MLEILMFLAWTCLTVYTVWYFTAAKHYAPITVDEARILWKIHRQHVKCSARKWKEIKRGGKIVGFECECGYRHMQKRPIKAYTPQLALPSQHSMFNTLHFTWSKIETQKD